MVNHFGNQGVNVCNYQFLVLIMLLKNYLSNKEIENAFETLNKIYISNIYNRSITDDAFDQNLMDITLFFVLNRERFHRTSNSNNIDILEPLGTIEYRVNDGGGATIVSENINSNPFKFLIIAYKKIKESGTLLLLD